MKKSCVNLVLTLLVGFFVLMFFVVKNNRTNIQDNEVESENRKKAESVFENDKDSALTKINENKKIVNGKKNSRNKKHSSTPVARDNEYGNKNPKKQSRFYGKVRLGLGYEYQRYTGSDVKDFFDDIDFSKNKSNQAPVISLGYNMYYTLNKRFALLGGLEAQGMYHVSGRKIVVHSKHSFFGGYLRYSEYLRLNAKLGLKTDLSKKVAVETYGIIGMNIMASKEEEFSTKSIYYNYIYKTSKMNVGLTTGAGVDFVIVDKFIVGVEYRYGLNKFNIGEENYKFKIKTHSVLAKIGYQF